MKLTNEIYLEQQQKLIMTAELRLAIAILQMSTLELDEYTQRELEENPLLEQKEAEDQPADNAADMAGEEKAGEAETGNRTDARRLCTRGHAGRDDAAPDSHGGHSAAVDRLGSTEIPGRYVGDYNDTGERSSGIQHVQAPVRQSVTGV